MHIFPRAETLLLDVGTRSSSVDSRYGSAFHWQSKLKSHSSGTGRGAYKGIFPPHIVPMGDKKLSHRTCVCIGGLSILL